MKKMKQSPFVRDNVRQFEVVAVFGEAQIVKRLDGRLEILGGTDENRQKAREWIALFIKPVPSPDSTELGKISR